MRTGGADGSCCWELQIAVLTHSYRSDFMSQLNRLDIYRIRPLAVRKPLCNTSRKKKRGSAHI